MGSIGMKFRFRLFILFLLFSSCSFGDELLRNKVDTLNSHSVELLGLSLRELSKLQGIRPGGHFVPLEILEGDGDFEILKNLEQKGYLSIEEMTEKHRKMLGDIPFDKTDRHILVTPKGVELLNVLRRTSI